MSMNSTFIGSEVFKRYGLAQRAPPAPAVRVGSKPTPLPHLPGSGDHKGKHMSLVK